MKQKCPNFNLNETEMSKLQQNRNFKTSTKQKCQNFNETEM